MRIDVIEPGLSTTIQDQGRNGYYHLGIPQSGSADQFSAYLANALVGNRRNAAVLECTYVGPTLFFDDYVEIAITGAPVTVLLDGKEQPMWTRIHVRPGQELSFGDLDAGIRFYIAVRGGIDVPIVLGSRSTYILGKLGGIAGRRLLAGDVLRTGDQEQHFPTLLYVAEKLRPIFSNYQEVRIVRGLYDHYLTEEGFRRLVKEEWSLTATADRMGLRYEGPGVEWVQREQKFGAGSDPSNIVDAGYAVGSIQIPGGTQPILLHRDAVSGGGYAMVATVISADMDVVARAAAGTITRFIEVTMEEALALRAERKKRLLPFCA
ncbi:biotin-dependent carboxyltransferase [Corynebacterium sp. sy017]|uniref:5-oxoprolinase subunit C family protein n=1 Tax=unclassified Corynebacterium TaxID=2624378 RepID=UPI0011849656|nr:MULTISPECIES: biotin-dependent carboxyltransferase family protein [unclassified Corynebacterium]MBP3088292.1 biotin-dependent carboxyltransferase [Corynebacterium sp. sy017]QDZ41749.1 biotin-dependent carboxyltransferase [Corynebacterium sp. sy039]TSD91616.1 biotin-dependent carboxyltransferase [Corynebacterium sp. SY003]